MAFRVPDWAVQPTRTSSIVGEDGGTYPIDAAPSTTLGGAACDVVIAGAPSAAPSAALVHHTKALYLIALDPATPVTLDGAPLPLHKPASVPVPGGRFTVGGATFTLTGEPAATAKRGREADAAPGPATVRASHLLVKHAGSRRPSSWKEPVVTRSLSEAREMVAAFRDRIARGTITFDQLASTESHCSSARSGGDLGVFGRGQMQRAFEDATFGLAVGELSGLVETDSGVHIILRTA